MKRVDKRFALIRDGRLWFAASIRGRGTSELTFRVARINPRDGYETVDSLKEAVRAVLIDKKMMRFATEGGKATTLSRRSRGVVGYRLDLAIAMELGLPPEQKSMASRIFPA